MRPSVSIWTYISVVPIVASYQKLVAVAQSHLEIFTIHCLNAIVQGL